GTVMAHLIIERVFDAPRELVWKAFTDPDQFAAWFGPVGYHVPRESVSFDLRPGGRQVFTMVPDSDDLPPAGESSGTVDDVVENELLLVHEDLTGDAAELFGTTRLELRIELHDEEGKTRLVVHQGPYGESMAGNAREGWGSSFTKLDALLAA
ncbi:MAG: hypothetical protein QOK15_3576, partial [Nocardioidaceae bacterium]|nr:hypothetical protein [Nocardioidaceae bacterium]